MVELRIYPSGFRGSALVRNTKPMDMMHSRNRMFSSAAIISPEAYPASLDVCALWETITNGDPHAKTFEFRERVLAVAMKVFGTQFFYEWVLAQRKSPNWDEWHERWIDETLAFVFDGKSREFSPHNWVGLLASAGKDAPQQDSERVRRTFFSGRVGDAVPMARFFQLWVQQKGGIEDLMESLYVLFGGR